MTVEQMCRNLLEQAKKCQTANGAAILLLVKNYLLDGVKGMVDCDELWQAADVMGRTDMLAAKDAEISRLKARIAELEERIDAFEPGGNDW